MRLNVVVVDRSGGGIEDHGATVALAAFEHLFYPRRMAVDLPCPMRLRLGGAGNAYSSPPLSGLLLEWRRVEAGHQGLVVWAQRVNALSGEWEVRMRWLDAGQFWAA